MDDPYEEICHTIRRVMLALIGYALFCLITIMKPDIAMFHQEQGINVPFANTPVAYLSFLYIAPLILVGLTIYLHIFIQRWFEQREQKDKNKKVCPPYLFNFPGPFSKAISWFLFYWLPPLLIVAFYIKAKPHPWSFLLLILAIITTVALTMTAYCRHEWTYETLRVTTRVTTTAVIILIILFIIDTVGYLPYFDRKIVFENQYLKVSNLKKYNLQKAHFLCTSDCEKFALKCKFTDADLREAEFENVSITGSRFDNANLQQAKFKGDTVFNDVDFREANLTGVNFPSKADLTKVQWTGAIFNNANLPQATLLNLDLINTHGYRANLWGADLREAKITNAEWVESDLSEANLTGVGFERGNLRDAKFWFACLAGSDLTEANLQRAKLNHADLAAWNNKKLKDFLVHLNSAALDFKKLKKKLDHSDPHGKVFRERVCYELNKKACEEMYKQDSSDGPDLLKTHMGTDDREEEETKVDICSKSYGPAKLVKADLSGADLSGANLSGANLSGANLSGADLRKVKGLNCEILCKAENWSLTFRDSHLLCVEQLIEQGL